jgi:Cof subfamily protein (haloacid dehalogenase superfamily)
VTIPRLIALDVDGTLLTSQSELHERTVEAIERVRRHDVLVTIATGRPYGAMGDVGRLADFVIAGNGATVFHMHGDQPGSIIYDRIVTRERGTPLIESIRATVPGVRIALVTSTEMVNEDGFEKLLPPNTPFGRRVGDALEADGDDFRSIIVFHEDMRAHEIIAIVDPMLRPDLELRYAGLDAGEISEPNVHKGTTLAWLANHVGVEQGDVWAFGDAVNDLEMLAWAGRGHAMGNAHELTKAAANVVVPTNDQHGVAVTLDAIEFSS